jgi:hypothetical protein
LDPKDRKMTYAQHVDEVPAQQTLDAGRLWAGGLATAVVAALVALVGFLIARGVFSVPVLAPEDDGAWGDASTPTYVVGAGLAALVATGIIHLLILFTPSPSLFFGWIMFLAILAGVVAPFASDAELSAKVATALINLAIGVAIWTLVAGVARRALRTGAARSAYREPPPGRYAG